MESLTLSQRDLTRLAVLLRLDDGRIGPAEAAVALRISARQLRRLRNRFAAEGAAGLRSRHLGRAPNNRLDAGVAEEAVALVRSRYADFGPTFANEKLRELHGLEISTETLRSLMMKHGLWKAKSRKTKIHQPRERRPYFGELVQVDGSRHDWFEGRAPWCTLLVFVDDATSALLALHFVKSESTATYFSLTADYLRRYGKPRAIYSDRHSVFHVGHENTKVDVRSQFARAMQELDVELICAHSPQAKGRVERANATLQHRLVRELRLLNLNSVDEANTYLPTFIDDYNARFAKSPNLQGDVHRQLTEYENLDRILAYTYTRKLTKNLTCQCDNIVYQILDRSRTVLRGADVQVRIQLDGQTLIERRGRALQFEAKPQSLQPKIATRKDINERARSRAHRPEMARLPAANHPWRRYAPQTPPQLAQPH